MVTVKWEEMEIFTPAPTTAKPSKIEKVVEENKEVLGIILGLTIPCVCCVICTVVFVIVLVKRRDRQDAYVVGNDMYDATQRGSNVHSSGTFNNRTTSGVHATREASGVHSRGNFATANSNGSRGNFAATTTKSNGSRGNFAAASSHSRSNFGNAPEDNIGHSSAFPTLALQEDPIDRPKTPPPTYDIVYSAQHSNPDAPSLKCPHCSNLYKTPADLTMHVQKRH